EARSGLGSSLAGTRGLSGHAGLLGDRERGMTQGQLIDLLLARLLRAHGGTRHRWRRLVGPVKTYSLDTHRHCNWAINPTGSSLEIGIIERLIDDLRMSHPIVSAD